MVCLESLISLDSGIADIEGNAAVRRGVGVNTASRSLIDKTNQFPFKNMIGFYKIKNLEKFLDWNFNTGNFCTLLTLVA